MPEDTGRELGGAHAPRPPILAVVRPGSHPHCNTQVVEALAPTFPDYDIRVIDVIDLFRRQRLRVAKAATAALLHYGFDIARRRRRPKDALLRTPTAARLLRQTALEALDALPDRPALTLQIQSLFDAHVAGVPHFIYTDHTHLANLDYPHFDPQQLYAKAWIECERDFYRHADLCLVRSGHVANSLRRDYNLPATKIRFVYSGANAPAPSAESRANPGSSCDIAFVGVDWERKGGPLLLRAFAQVRRRHPNATLTIVGCTPPIEESLALGVRVVGRLPLDDVSRSFAQAGVFCLPTLIEPFGVVVLEAMAHALPVVATNIGAMPDMVEDGRSGILVAPGDLDALAEALDRLLADPALRTSAGLRGLEIAADRYTWPAVAVRIRESVAATGACEPAPTAEVAR